MGGVQVKLLDREGLFDAVVEPKRETALIGALPSWGYSKSWGYGPTGGLGLVVLIVVVLLVMGKI